MKIIAAKANQQVGYIELSYTGSVDAAILRRLKTILEAGGFTINVREQSGTTVWQCDLPFGDIATEDVKTFAQNAIAHSGATTSK